MTRDEYIESLQQAFSERTPVEFFGMMVYIMEVNVDIQYPAFSHQIAGHTFKFVLSDGNRIVLNQKDNGVKLILTREDV